MEDDEKALVIRSSSDDVRKQLLFNLPTLLRIVYRLHFNVPILCNVMQFSQNILAHTKHCNMLR